MWEDDVIGMIYGERVYHSGEYVVWVLHVPKEGRPELDRSPGREKEDVLRRMPTARAESMAATLLEQLAKVEA